MKVTKKFQVLAEIYKDYANNCIVRDDPDYVVVHAWLDASMSEIMSGEARRATVELMSEKAYAYLRDRVLEMSVEDGPAERRALCAGLESCGFLDFPTFLDLVPSPHHMSVDDVPYFMSRLDDGLVEKVGVWMAARNIRLWDTVKVFLSTRSAKKVLAKEVLDEWKALMQAAHCWASEHMDQWDKVKFITPFGMVYLSITRETEHPGDFYQVDANGKSVLDGELP